MSTLVEIKLHGPADDLGDRDTIESFMDRIMEQLLECVTDPSVSESFEDDGVVTLEFLMEVDEDQLDAAVTVAMSALRSAFHTVGASTPGWEDMIQAMRSDVRATSEDSDLVDA